MRFTRWYEQICEVYPDPLTYSIVDFEASCLFKEENLANIGCLLQHSYCAVSLYHIVPNI